MRKSEFRRREAKNVAGGRPPRFFVLTDMEGAAGVSKWSQVNVRPEEQLGDYRQAKLWLTNEVNACVEGVLEKVPQAEIVVWDGHGSGGINLEQLHPGAKFISRGFFPCPYGLDEGYSAVLMIAQHAKSGTPGAVLPHSYSLNVYRFWLNGRETGEIALRAYLAGYYKIPVILATGDKAACEEAASLIPGIETVAVKKAIHGELAITLQPKKACQLIREGARKAVAGLLNHKAARPLKTRGPFVFRAQYLSSRVTSEMLSRGNGIMKIDDFTLETRGNDLLTVIQPFA